MPTFISVCVTLKKGEQKKMGFIDEKIDEKLQKVGSFFYYVGMIAFVIGVILLIIDMFMTLSDFFDFIYRGYFRPLTMISFLGIAGGASLFVNGLILYGFGKVVQKQLRD